MTDLITKPPALDETLKGVTAELAKLVLLKEHELQVSAYDILDWHEFASLVESGAAEDMYPVGSTVTEKWTDPRPGNAREWDYASRVAAYEDIVVRGGIAKKAATMHSKLALPFGTQFANYQAFLSAIDGLPAGTYHVTMGFSWGSNVVSGKSYQFTLTQALPAGGQLAGFRGAPDQNPSNWRVYAYASAEAVTETETCVVTEGTGGTNLGTFTAAGYALVPASGTPATTASVTIGGTAYTYYGLNSLHRVAYGNNRWLHSAIRQFLNSSGASWWKPQHVFDRPPSYVTYDGFLTGFPEAMVERMAYREVKTSLNRVTDGGTNNGTECDVTYDRVFLPSAEQMNWNCTWLGVPYGVEGDAWEFWKEVFGETPATMGVVHPEFCMASMDAPTTMRNVFQRSPYRGYGSYVAYVHASGYVNYTSAVRGNFVAPAYSII